MFRQSHFRFLQKQQLIRLWKQVGGDPYWDHLGGDPKKYLQVSGQYGRTERQPKKSVPSKHLLPMAVGNRDRLNSPPQGIAEVTSFRVS